MKIEIFSKHRYTERKTKKKTPSNESEILSILKKPQERKTYGRKRIFKRPFGKEARKCKYIL